MIFPGVCLMVIKSWKKSSDLLNPVYSIQTVVEHNFESLVMKGFPATGLEYIDCLLDKFNVSYYVSQRSRINIPAVGRVIIFANHPISSIDGLALMRCLNDIRQDVKLVSMDLFTDCDALGDRIIRVSRKNMSEQRRNIKTILEALRKEQAVVVFPAIKAPSLRRLNFGDSKWSHRFIKLAVYSNAPLLPVFIESKVYKKPAFFMRSNKVSPIERGCDIFISVGELIANKEIELQNSSLAKQCKRLRHHLYRVGKGLPGVFSTQKPIVHPQPISALRSELSNTILLGETPDKQQIYLFDYQADSVLLREIGRLREYTFRLVGEGTGEHIDLDRYDRIYRHIVLWNDRELEVVGAYRFAEAGKIYNKHGLKGLYCHELFELGKNFQNLLPVSIELGRSFVQPKYWGKRSLDYLWYGIGAYIRQHPSLRYMYGPVSISNNYPEPAKQALVQFYSSYFGSGEPLANARRNYSSGTTAVGFGGCDYKADLTLLREYLRTFDVRIPTLYKQYTELCESGGVVFDAFSVDPDFGYCVDGLIRVEINKIKRNKFQRYIGA